MKSTGRTAVLVLAGVLFGLVFGVEFAQKAGEAACPKRPCVDGARLTPVTDREYGPKAVELIRAARESVHITSLELKYYENYKNSSVNEVVRELMRAHERGVDVKILVDEYSRENNAFDVLSSAGVDIRWDDNTTTTHAKIVIIDGEVVLIGSTNFSYYSFEKNREANVVIEDERTAAYYEGYFASLWSNS